MVWKRSIGMGSATAYCCTSIGGSSGGESQSGDVCCLFVGAWRPGRPLKAARHPRRRRSVARRSIDGLEAWCAISCMHASFLASLLYMISMMEEEGGEGEEVGEFGVHLSFIRCV
ncbi:receptor like protein kinase S.2 [Iris pallida]|uniref:Receptor like protein kinase S.2 n=1 Tax=Iris pallida TaxID=29817 RepID=A0AAX6FE84_IRIPA|nr:receptor like protein kinase S.2 [Iris pallida]